MSINYWLKYGNTPLGYNGSAVAFAHVEQPGTLTISVQVSGTGFDPSRTFGFRVAFGSSIDYTVNGVAIPASSNAYTGSLANGQSVVLGNIPYGTAYSVTEDAIPSSDIGYFNGQVTGASGTMTDGGALSSVATFEYEAGYALIGGTRYRTTTINGITYMAENLDFKWPGLTIVTTPAPYSFYDYNPYAGYPNGNEATYGRNGLKYGLLYDIFAFLYMHDNASTLFPGWHVMTFSERVSLFLATGNDKARALKSSVQWNGTDSLGFSAVPTGWGVSTSYGDRLWMNVGRETKIAYYGTSTNPDVCECLLLETGSRDIWQDGYGRGDYYSVRLVKD